MNSRKPRAKLDEDALFEYAVRALTARSSSTEELRFKLRQRAAKLTDVDSVIGRLKEVGYLDDKRFAEMFTAMRVENDGFGRARVLHDLRGRRVSGKIADGAIARAFQNKDELEMVAAYVERRMPAVVAGGHSGDDRKLGAAYRRLRRAGFGSGPILTVLKRYAARPELLDEPPGEEPEND
jgi:regulatory protein